MLASNLSVSLPTKGPYHISRWDRRYAEKKGFTRQNPFDGLVVLEVDWSGLSGFEYWNALEQAGRLCMETSRVQKRCFHSVEAAVRLPSHPLDFAKAEPRS